MALIDETYHKLLNVIINNGFTYEDPNRKGVNRIQIPSYKIEHNFKDGFPAITTKKLYWKGIVGELIWFLRGDTNIRYLLENKISIWNKDAYNYFLKSDPMLTRCTGPDNCQDVPFMSDNPQHLDLFLGETLSGKSNTGNLGRVYGAQWRNWNGRSELPINISPDNMYQNYTTQEILDEWKKHINNIGISIIDSNISKPQTFDQITNLIKRLKENPMGTRHIVTAWNPAELDQMALPPCHWSFEILVEPMSFTERINNYNYVVTTELKSDETWLELLEAANIPKFQFTLKWHQRSVDTFLGLPFNIASYALLAHIIGKMANMIPKGIEGDLSNVHVYEPHLDSVKKQLNNDVNKYKSCTLATGYTDHFWKAHEDYVDGCIRRLDIESFTLKNYNSYPAIKAEMLPYNK